MTGADANNEKFSCQIVLKLVFDNLSVCPEVNIVKGSGSVGFQPGIAAAAPGDNNYSPMWRIYMISWNEPEQATVLETRADINALKSEGLITVNLARPMNSVHIVNSPFIDPFQEIITNSTNG